MVVLVSDTSVLIDLERGLLLEPCFLLPLEFAVPDLLYKRELADYEGPKLIETGLRIVELSNDELCRAQEIRAANLKLSLPDAYAYSLAFERDWTLLTGDGELRKLALSAEIPFHGVLWLLDQIFDNAIVETSKIISGLRAIAEHPRCRLPRHEIQVRLVRYRAALR